MFKLEDALFEDWRRQVVARITPGAGQGVDDVKDGRHPYAQPSADFLRRYCFQFLAQFFGLPAVLQHALRITEFCQQLSSNLVALWVDRRPVQGTVAADDSQEPRGLHVACGPDRRHRKQLLTALERAVLLAVVD